MSTRCHQPTLFLSRISVSWSLLLIESMCWNYPQSMSSTSLHTPWSAWKEIFLHRKKSGFAVIKAQVQDLAVSLSNCGTLGKVLNLLGLIFFSTGKWSHSVVSDCLQSHGTVAYQALLCMGFSRQENWSGLPLPSLGDLPNLGIKPRSPSLQAGALPSEPPGKHFHQ